MIRVQKFGGKSLSTPEQIKEIAINIANNYKNNFKQIIVLSAMGTTTNELMNLSKKICDSPSQREMDMLLSSGERISISLMSMALQNLGCKAISFTGSQAGIMTTGDHNDATIKELKPIRVDEALNQNKIAIVAGYQGVNPDTKEITTLGRGGSDTTAVAFASHYNVSECEIYKDVDGIFESDPKEKKDAKLFDSITYDDLLKILYNGSGILHHKSVEHAQMLETAIRVMNINSAQDYHPSENKNFGTLVSK